MTSTCGPEALTNLYDWLETIPFSRPKKNFARDFSDGVLAAEMVKHFFPNLVDLHNYPSSCSFAQKKVNWSVLNRKVLRKLDFPLSDVTMSDLAVGSKRDATEYFLHTLRQKIDICLKKDAERLRNDKDLPQSGSDATVESALKDSKHSSLRDIIGDSSLVGKQNTRSRQVKEDPMHCSSMRHTADGDSDLVGIRQTVKRVEIRNHQAFLKDSVLESVPRDAYDEKVQEWLAGEEMIQVLRARIRRLETTLQMKNVTVERLQQTIERLKVTRQSNHVTVTGDRECKSIPKKSQLK